MKDYIKSVFVLAIILVLNCPSFAADSEYQKIDPNKVPDKLVELASIIKTNYEKIRTWKGKMTYHNFSVYRDKEVIKEYLKEFAGVELAEEPNELHRIADTNSEFQIDIENNQFYRHMNRTEPLVYMDPEKGVTYKSFDGPLEDIKIVTPVYQVNIYPYRRTKDFVTLERRAKKERPIRTEGEDPREAFNVARPIWEFLSRFSQSLKMKGIETYSVVLEEKVDGNNVTFRIQIFDPGKSQPSSIIILSGKEGFNPVYVEQRHNNGSVTIGTTEFVNIDGVFLPSEWNTSLYYPDGGLMRDVIRTISNMQVNVPIPDSTFSEINYLREGEKLIDRTNNKKEFVLKAGRFVEVAEPNK